MLRNILVILLFLLSLLAVFPTPSGYIWYLTIMVTEFPWIFIAITASVIFWSWNARKHKLERLAVLAVAFLFFSYPVVGAYRAGGELKQKMVRDFGAGSIEMSGLHQETPFSFWRMVSGIGDVEVPYTTYQYATHTGVGLTLDFYKAIHPDARPCVVIAHGGSWARGNSQELPDIDWYLARQGYNVASINYRLAPTYKSPSPVEDMQTAIAYLKANAKELKIDTGNFVLLGRSAGGQIVLESAYTLHDKDIKGVVDLYGPTDMVWAYQHPDNPLVMNSQQVMQDFFGGSFSEVPEKYHDGSPINYVTPESTPTLIIHGANDAHVRFELAKMLDRKLNENYVKHVFLGLPWATHGCEYSLNGPSGQLAKYAIERFVYQVTHTKK